MVKPEKKCDKEQKKVFQFQDKGIQEENWQIRLIVTY